MSARSSYTLEEIDDRLQKESFPLEGVTALGSASFSFRVPSQTLGLALHAGSRVRSGLLGVIGVTAKERSREEDLFTDHFVQDFPLAITGRDSRFEYDLNWEEEQCIYPFGRDKWGLRVWKRPLTEEETRETLVKYREFHQLLDLIVAYIIRRYGSALLYDIHSFRYQREGPTRWWEDPKPEINLGTSYIDRDYFAPQVEAFIQGASGIRLEGHRLRVGENKVFPGGYLTRKYGASHPREVLVLAVEYKKIFMDEIKGTLFREHLDVLKNNLLRTRERIPRITG